MIQSSTHNIEDNAFSHIPEYLKKKIVKMMARVMERAYRRGVQQALQLHYKSNIDSYILDNLYDYRYCRSIDESYGLDGYRTTSIKRLDIEEDLRRVGLEPEAGMEATPMKSL